MRLALCDYRQHLRPGEVPVILCLASDRDQARIVHGYIVGYFRKTLCCVAWCRGRLLKVST